MVLVGYLKDGPVAPYGADGSDTGSVATNRNEACCGRRTAGRLRATGWMAAGRGWWALRRPRGAGYPAATKGGMRPRGAGCPAAVGGGLPA